MAPQRDLVIITGSSGFIGSALVARLTTERYALVGFDRAVSRQPPPAAECICIDLTTEAAIEAALARVRIAYGPRIASVIHLAAYFDLTGEPNPNYHRVTVGGTERLIRALRSFEVEQFVFSSTMLVHKGVRPGERISEDSPLDPNLPYPESKIRTERLILSEHGQVPVVLARLAGIYDDHCRNPFLAHQIARIHERRLISRVYPGDLRTGQSFLHVDDLAEAVAAIVNRRHELPNELTVLLGEDEVIGFGELQRELGCLLHGEEWATHEIPKSVARTGSWLEGEVLDEDPFIKPWMVDTADEHYALDVSRARATLRWDPKRSLRQTLPKMVSALKADPAAWYRRNQLNAAKVASLGAERAAENPAEDPIEHHEMVRRHAERMRRMRSGELWTHFVNIGLGVWLATVPFVLGTFQDGGFSDAVLHVTEERGLPPPELRSAFTAWSDLASGLLVTLFGVLSLSERFRWAPWANVVVGTWLFFAPLVAWAPSAAVYLNDTMVGALVIAFAVLVPMMPGMSHEGMMDETDVPPGWTYSPSTYLQRLPIIGLGLVGFVIARVLSAYQLGHVDAVWEPFFSGEGGRNGTEFIITSEVSKAWPIADGGLGAVSYMFEVLMGAMGDSRRWRTMPWMVLLFGIVVVPLGVVSIYFIIIQPIVIGTYCTLCLIAALAMLIMIPYTLDELVAMGQFLVLNARRGRPFWRTFFMGDALAGGGRDRTAGFDAPGRAALNSAARGVTLPWTLVACALLGAWLMFTRLTFRTLPPMADSDHLVGALLITVAMIAMAEVARPVRFINALIGLWLIAAPWTTSGASLLASINVIAIGIMLVMLSLPRGRRSREHYGAWDRYVF